MKKKNVMQRMLEEIDHYQPRQMKVAILTNRFYPEVGGVETNLNFQAMGLTKDYQVTVLCPKRMEGPDFETRDGFEVIRFPDWFNWKKNYPNLKAKTFCPGLFWHLIKSDYHVLQAFPSINYNNMLAWIGCWLQKIPMILCSFDFLDYGEIIKREGRVRQDILASYPLKTREKFFIKHFDHIFAISGKELDLFKKYNPHSEFSPVPILVDEYSKSNESPRNKYGISKDEFVFLSLGRVSNIKGQDIALKAFRTTLPRLGNAKLIFVGRYDYEPEYYQAMKDYIDANQLSNRVLFTGMVNREEVLGWLRDSDIHVIPVRFMNSGAVVVETWISGRPVIQSDVVDPNLVEPGVNGYLFHSEDENDLARVMIKAYDEKDRFSELARNGKQLVLEKFTYEYLIQLYTKTYRDVLSRRKN